MYFLFLYCITFVLSFQSSTNCTYPLNRNIPVCYNNFDSEFYSQFEPYLPTVDTKVWKDDLQIYLPNLDEVNTQSGLQSCVDDSSFNSTDTHHGITGKAYYFTWVSTDVYKQPIFSAIMSGNCGDKCPDESGRGCEHFQTCLLSTVSHYDFSSTEVDRGHLVPNSAAGTWWNASAETFNMCNISPQTKRMNQDDWRQLEEWVECYGKYHSVVIYAGPLFPVNAFEHCVCEDHIGGTVTCAQCGDENALPLPYAFWKVIVDTKTFNTWTFIFDKAQMNCLSDVSPDECEKGGSIESIHEAFVPSGGLDIIEKNINIRFPVSMYYNQQSTTDILNQEPRCKNETSF